MRLLETEENVLDSLIPSAVAAPTMTTAMSAAIRPYSMADVPDSH